MLPTAGPGRVVEERLGSTSGIVVASYTSATSGSSKGLLISTASFDDTGDQVSSETYTYDRRGRTLTRTITIGSDSYQFAYGYDTGGLVTMSYPDFGAGVETLTYTHDTLGRAVSLVSSLGEDLVTDATYLPDGSLTAVTLLADGSVPVTRQWNYDTTTRRLVGLTAGTSGLGSSNLQNLGFTHDLNGNIVSVVDTHNSGQVQCFGYDPSQRLTAAFTTGSGTCATPDTGVGAGGFDTGWVLDAAGRVRSRTDGSDITVFGFDGHRVISTSTTSGTESHTYDAAGYMTDSGAASLGWDGRGRLISWSDGATDATFGYDHSGERMTRTIDTDTTRFVAGVEITDTHTVVPYTFGGHTVATRTYTTTSNQVEVVLGDHLGSPHTVVDDTGTVAGVRLHEPYGQVRHETGGLPGSVGFTGQTTDPTGLMYYGARYYSPVLHTFISPDSIVADPTSTADWNRYAYVRGNPVNYTDPTGHCVPTTMDGRLGNPLPRPAGVSCESGAWTLGDAAYTAGVFVVTGAAGALVGGVCMAATGGMAAAGCGGMGTATGGLVYRHLSGHPDPLDPGAVAIDVAIGVGLSVAGRFIARLIGKIKPTTSVVPASPRVPVNSAGHPYPQVIDPRTGSPILHPGSGLSRVPAAERVPWTAQERATYIKQWYDRGFETPSGGWSRYDIHHIRPREYGGTNDFLNLVPVLRSVHQQEFNTWWRGY